MLRLKHDFLDLFDISFGGHLYSHSFIAIILNATISQRAIKNCKK